MLPVKLHTMPAVALSVKVDGELADPSVRVRPVLRLFAITRLLVDVKTMGPLNVMLVLGSVEALATVKPAFRFIGLAIVRLPPTASRNKLLELLGVRVPKPNGPEGTPVW